MSRSLAQGRYMPYVNEPKGIATWDGCNVDD